MNDTIQVDDLVVGPAMVRTWREQLAEFRALLIESRKWQAEGEFGDPLGPECWTTAYKDYMQRLDAAIKEFR